MYKIESVTNVLLTGHFDRYATETKRLMIELLEGTITIPGELGRKGKIDITYKVKKGSPTYLFLKKYSQENNLRKLLCGSWDDLLKVIEDVNIWIPNLRWQHRATKEKYTLGEYQKDGFDAENRVLIDHFNEILHWLFIDQMYEDQIDKLRFIQELNLKICPYCGRQHINVAQVTGRRDSKPPIDHFLPKSLYPFLAISFRNMVPVCTVCNDITNKGDYDPINPTVGLENPYSFDDTHVIFKGDFNIKNEQDENSFNVDIICNPVTLDKGYKEVLKLLPFYQDEKIKMQDMYINFTTNTDSFKEYLKDLGVKQQFLDNVAKMVIGHRLDGKASQRAYYKFHKDLLLQLLEHFKMI